MIIAAEFHSNSNAILDSFIGQDNLCIERKMHSDETLALKEEYCPNAIVHPQLNQVEQCTNYSFKK